MNKKKTHIKVKVNNLILGIPILGDYVRVYTEDTPRGFYQWTIKQEELNNLIDRLECNMIEACIEALLDRDALMKQEDGTYLLKRTFLKNKHKSLKL